MIEPCASDQFKQAAQRPLRAGLKVDLVETLLKTRMLTADEGIRLAEKLSHS